MLRSAAQVHRQQREGGSPGDHKVTNIGNGADNQISAVGGSCAWNEETVKFTFGPSGNVRGFCCNGGSSCGGHVSDCMKLLLRRGLYNQNRQLDVFRGKAYVSTCGLPER
jgi:hypothetical protein